MKHSKLFSLIALILAALMAFTACGSTQAVSTEAPETTATTEAPVKTRTVLESLTTEVMMGDMAISTREEHFYDEQGLLTQIISYSADEEVSRTTVENDEHGEVIRQTAVSGGRTMVTESELTYDENSNLTKRVDTVSTDGTVTDIREYTYNSDHTLATAHFTTLGDNPYTTSNSYEYDEEGKEILEIREDSAGGILHIETEYDETGRAVRVVSKNTSGEVTQYSENTYDENGVLKQTTYSPDGTPSPSYTLTTYNEHGNPLTMETYLGDALSLRITYTYITVPAFK